MDISKAYSDGKRKKKKRKYLLGIQLKYTLLNSLQGYESLQRKRRKTINN